MSAVHVSRYLGLCLALAASQGFAQQAGSQQIPRSQQPAGGREIGGAEPPVVIDVQGHSRNVTPGGQVSLCFLFSTAAGVQNEQVNLVAEIGGAVRGRRSEVIRPGAPGLVCVGFVTSVAPGSEAQDAEVTVRVSAGPLVRLRGQTTYSFRKRAGDRGTMIYLPS